MKKSWRISLQSWFCTREQHTSLASTQSTVRHRELYVKRCSVKKGPVTTMMAFRVAICAAVLLVLTVSVNGYSSGAPATACDTFAPKHPGKDDQQGPPPYNFGLNSNNIPSGSSVTVTLSKSTNGPFQGFFLQARKSGGATAVGKWVPVSGVSKGVDCHDQTNSSLTHIDKSEKDQIIGEWVPPGPGKYEIFYTVAQNYGIFWVGRKSQTITVV